MAGKTAFLSLFLLLLSSIVLSLIGSSGGGWKREKCHSSKGQTAIWGKWIPSWGNNKSKSHSVDGAWGICWQQEVTRVQRVTGVPWGHQLYPEHMEAQQSDVPANTLRTESSRWVAVTVPGRNRASLEVSATHTFLCKTEGLSCPSGASELPSVSHFSL